MAALVLVRFLVALPIGAIVGGYLIRTRSAGLVTAVGMSMSAVGFALMSRWGVDTLDDPSSNIALVVCGFGFGLALAPVNAAILRPAPIPTCTASRPRWWWSPGWSGCWSASRR